MFNYCDLVRECISFWDLILGFFIFLIYLKIRKI